jgi:hypothetical protein
MGTKISYDFSWNPRTIRNTKSRHLHQIHSNHLLATTWIKINIGMLLFGIFNGFGNFILGKILLPAKIFFHFFIAIKKWLVKKTILNKFLNKTFCFVKYLPIFHLTMRFLI